MRISKDKLKRVVYILMATITVISAIGMATVAYRGATQLLDDSVASPPLVGKMLQKAADNDVVRETFHFLPEDCHLLDHVMVAVTSPTLFKNCRFLDYATVASTPPPFTEICRLLDFAMVADVWTNDNAMQAIRLAERANDIVRLEIVLLTDPLEFIPEIPKSEYYAGVIAVFADGFQDFPFSSNVEWESSDSGVFVVHSNGAIQPTGPGTATVIANYNGVVAEKEVTVTEASIERLSTWPEELVLIVDINGSGRIVYMPEVFVLAHTPSGRVHEITASPLISFLSKDTNIVHPSEAFFDNFEQHLSRISIISLGETVIVASMETPYSRADNLSVSLPVYVLGVENIKEISMFVGYEVWANSGGTIKAYAVFENGMQINIMRQAHWHSDNTNVLKVYDGFITALNPGDVVVTATFAGVSGSINLNVLDWRSSSRNQ